MLPMKPQITHSQQQLGDGENEGVLLPVRKRPLVSSADPAVTPGPPQAKKVAATVTTSALPVPRMTKAQVLRAQSMQQQADDGFADAWSRPPTGSYDIETALATNNPFGKALSNASSSTPGVVSKTSDVRVPWRVYQQAQATGTLNLAGFGLRAVPDEATRVPEIVANDFADGNTDEGAKPWWERMNVSKLDLAHNEICELPTTLARVAGSLEALLMAHNRLASFPGALLGQFEQLTVLDLSHNQLRGVLALGQTLRHLVELDLSHNELAAVPAAFLAACPMLVRVDLSFNAIAGGVGMWDGGFPQLLELRRLRLNNNRLDGELVLAGALPLLRELEVQHNRLLQLAALALMPQLERLDASHNALTHFPACGGGGGQQLRELALGDNALRGVDSAGLSGMRRLEILDLSSNKLEQFADERVVLLRHALHTVLLQNNNLAAVTPLLGFCEKLQTVRLDGNRLWGMPKHLTAPTASAEAVRLYLRGAVDFARLQNLDPAFVRAFQAENGFQASCIAPAVFTSSSSSTTSSSSAATTATTTAATAASVTTVAKVSANNEETRPRGDIVLAGTRLQSLPRWIWRGREVYVLDVHNNELAALEAPTDDEAMREEALAGFLPGVRRLDASYNRLEQLPGADWWGACRFLAHLDLSRNTLTGALPAALWALRSLVHLNVENNALSDLGMPGEIAGSALETLRAGQNRLERVPLALQQLTQLRHLDVSNNRIADFCGTAAEQAAGLNRIGSEGFLGQHLAHCNLSNNNLQAVAPQLGLCPRLVELHLYGNCLKGFKLQVLSQSAVDIKNYLRLKLPAAQQPQ